MLSGVKLEKYIGDSLEEMPCMKWAHYRCTEPHTAPCSSPGCVHFDLSDYNLHKTNHQKEALALSRFRGMDSKNNLGLCW